MKPNLQSFASLLIALGIILGAFGAHALADQLAENGRTSVWETAVLYHLIHALALWILALTIPPSSPKRRAVAFCWLLGILFFSGSLYLISLGGPSFLGPVTPIGGTLFITGWLLAPFLQKT